MALTLTRTVFMACVVAGCCELSAVNFSSPQASPGIRTIRFSARDHRIISRPQAHGAAFELLDGLGVELEVPNQQWMELSFGPNLLVLPLPIIPLPSGIARLFRGTPAPAPLKIWLRVGPMAHADFDPLRMRVLLSDGVAVEPTALIGEQCEEYSECFVRYDLPALPLEPLAIERSAVFVMSFPLEASPDRIFTVRVEGFTRNAAAVGAFDVYFRQATAWTLLTFP